MGKITLSICIPIYNRQDIFQYNLNQACRAVGDFYEQAEIVVSDNNSEQDLSSIVKRIQKEFPDINIKYHKNKTNIGLAKNFLKTVELASGEFCWIIGGDDFVKQNAVEELITIIKDNANIDFICCNYDMIYLNQIQDQIKNNLEIKDYLSNSEYLIPHVAPTESFALNSVQELIQPKFNNVFLGAVMTGIFKKEIWDSVEKSKITDKFNDVASVYPHCYIYANGFLNKKAYYCGTPLITVGEGAREWSTETGNSYWESSLPLIYFRVIPDMIEEYKINGLNNLYYQKSKNWVGYVIGTIFLKVFFRKSIMRKNIKNQEFIKPASIFSSYKNNYNFQKALIKTIVLAPKKLIKYIWRL